jgi:CheY-like chemotaxis protein/HPt (histidine-containing phosphotransfer) domain-containing protein
MDRLNKRLHTFFFNELERSRNTMLWGGLIVFFAHPIYFFVWTYLLPQPYDNFYLRLSAAIFAVPVILQKYWSKRFENYLVICWHFCLIYALPFVCTFLTIKNSFSTMWMMTEVMIIFIMALCISAPLLLMTYVTTGIFAAFLACILTSETPLIITATDEANLALLPIVLLCSMVFSNTMKKGSALVEKTKAITALAGSIAHEMRNPLGQMKYALDGISHLLPTPNTSNTNHVVSAKTVNDIYTNIAQGLISCDRGLEVIDITLHEVSNQEIDPANFEYLSAATITEKAIEEYSFDSKDERNRVTLHNLNDFTFKVDETTYIYVIFNLIKNALYYFQDYPNAKITIAIDHQKITITDTGPGIHKQLLGKLFNNFITADKTRGTGLGLAYCHRVMQAFQGKITCESVVGQYTTFTLTFPAIMQEEIDAYTKAVFQEAIPLFQHKRILVVDDQIVYHSSVHHMLKDLGCQIDGAENGQAAINMLMDNQYDLIVMDIIMPGKDGYMTTEEIRSGIVFQQKNIPILAHTSETPYMAKIKTQKVGMDGFVSKPCTQLELIKAIYQTMERAKHRNSFEKTGDYLKGKTILIVDDESFNRQYLEIYTNEWGMHTLHAESGQAALDILKKEPHLDIIFMDMHMPLMSGVETTKRIRSNPAYQHIIIVALTGNFSEQAIQEAKAAGMNDFVNKPFDQIVLQQKLTHLLTEKNLQEKKSVQPKIDPAVFNATTAEFLSAAHQHAYAKEVYTYVNEKLTPLRQDRPLINTTATEIITAEDSSSNRYIPAYQSQVAFFKDMPLIDYARLKSSQTSFKDKFQEFLHRMIQNLIRRDNELQIGYNNNDREAILNALHSFLGVAGYVGAHALHQYIKLRLYPEVYAGRLPDEEAWVETVQALVQISVDALRRDCVIEI